MCAPSSSCAREAQGLRCASNWRKRRDRNGAARLVRHQHEVPIAQPCPLAGLGVRLAVSQAEGRDQMVQLGVRLDLLPRRITDVERLPPQREDAEVRAPDDIQSGHRRCLGRESLRRRAALVSSGIELWAR